ncbi:MAG: transcriptional repressor LexA [Patescibacteria group bacterium]
MKERNTITKRQKELLLIIYNSLKDEGYPPSLEELRSKLNVKSNQAVIDHLNGLEKKGTLTRAEGIARSIVLTQKGFDVLNLPPLIANLGTSYAGAFAGTYQTDLWTTLSDEVKINQNMFLVQISGDSMIDAGINNGDTLVAQRSSEFTNRDIVVAQLHEGTTVKRFMTQNHAPRKFLKPENKKYDILYFKPDTKMQAKIIGKLVNEQIIPINPMTKSFL